MARVDPYVVKVPVQITDPKTGNVTKEFADWLKYDNRWKQQLWIKVGGGDDFITDTEEGLTSASSKISRNAAKINALEKIGFDIEIITADFTTNRNQIIICNNTSSINVTLDPDAIEEDSVHIKRTSAVVEVIGTVDGKTNIRINVKFFSVHLVFNGTDWSQI